MTDPSIREQSYRYFLQEAPELLQVLEQDLLNFREDYSINKVHTLMRTTHTLKGAAASVGLETIATVAHSLEDIFKALFNPDLSIDQEVEALLFEGYECLRLPLTAEFTGGRVNDAEILDRAAAVFAQLQDKLGDCFGQEPHLPSSAELGFDLTQSIFEVGVAQRLEEIAAALASADPAVVAPRLQTQAEVFVGLAESLNLPGFGAIAQATIAALQAYPERAVTIAQTALADFQAGQTAVLAGDRTQGGQPSLDLQQLAGFAPSSNVLDINSTEVTAPVVEQEQAIASSSDSAPTTYQTESIAKSSNSPLGVEDGVAPESHSTPIYNVDAPKSATHPELDGVTTTADSELNLSDSQNEELGNPLLELIWGGEAMLNAQESDRGDPALADSIPVTTPHQEAWNPIESAAMDAPASRFASSGASATDPTNLSGDEPEVPLSQQLPESVPTPASQKTQGSESRTVRVNVEHLERLNYSIGELLTNQNRQSLQNEQLRSAVRTLLTRINQHQQLLSQLQDWSDRLFVDAEQQRLAELGVLFSEKGQRETSRSFPTSHSSFLPPHSPPTTYPPSLSQLNRFDSLELDRYSESQLLVQSILEDAVQLAEASEAIDLFAMQSTQTLEKQRRLLTGTRDALMEARMLPLGDIFDRFPRVLQQLEALHNKPVALEVSGADVLVDKVVAEKLYGPLLHLVRNAFGHGIESPKVRQQSGKQKIGQIEICAYHQSKSLMIEVRDDGQGLDFEKIRQQAVERQLVEPERVNALNEAQLTNLLFEPGFSTNSQVNDLSGRGIGLDMVRAQLQALQGSVAVYSEPRRGTTFVLQIPLSLSIAKLLLIQSGDSINQAARLEPLPERDSARARRGSGHRVYALLADAIEQILIPQPDRVRCFDGGKVLQWSKGDVEQLVPVYPLAQILDYSSWVSEASLSQPRHSPVSKEQTMPVILIRCQDKLLGLEVDRLLGEQELVIRPLGAAIAPPSYVYGSSILPDGRLTLAIDGAALMQYVLDRQIDGSSANNWASSTSSALPSRPQPRLLPSQTPAALPASPNPDWRAKPGKLILVVDDSITVRQTLVLTLQRAGYQVFQAKDGYEAIEQLQQHADIHLVICDIEMPRMNGFEFLKYRQQDPALAEIPILVLTSRSGEKHRTIAWELGATGYITKPFLERNLLAMVSELLEKNILNSVPR